MSKQGNYGARYYNPRVSIWLSVDPIAVYNPIFETEHYIDGQHNGGVFNAGNLNVYGYCYQNPIKWVDPNGKQVNFSDKFVKNVLSGKKFSSYSDFVFSPGKILNGESPFVYNCWHAAARQVEYGGNYRTANATELSNLRVHMINEYRPSIKQDIKVDVQKGVDMIIKNLNEGKSVVVGVDYGVNSESEKSNSNKATDHFVNVVGYGKDNKGYYFSYYDNAIEGGEDAGTDTQKNRLYYNSKTNQFEDNSGIHGKKIIMTEVRETIDKPKPSNQSSLIYDGFEDFNRQGGNKW